MKISKETYELIGKLSIEFNKMEFFLSLFLDSLKNTPTYVIPNESRISYNRKIQLLRSCINPEVFNEEEINELLDTSRKLELFGKKRNEIIHSYVIHDLESKSEVFIFAHESIKQKKKVTKEIVHPELEQLIKEISLTGNELMINSVYFYNKAKKS